MARLIAETDASGKTKRAPGAFGAFLAVPGGACSRAMKRPVALVPILLASAVLALALTFLVRSLSPASLLDFEHRVTRSVSEQLVSISATTGDRLELASVETVEIFRDTDKGVILGTTEAEVRVPVVYRFHVSLGEGIRVGVKRHGDLIRCVVNAPALRPTLPPAIRTEGLEKRASSGWARFDGGDLLRELEKNLTAELVNRAGGKADLARDKARAQLAGFVSRWLIRDGLWGGSAGVREIVVLFPGESDVAVSPTLRVGL